MAEADLSNDRRDHRLASFVLSLLAAAGFGLASPAEAETRQASLSVGATVETTCLVGSSTAAAGAVSCTHPGEGSVRVEREPAVPTSANPPATQKSDTATEVSYITITY